MRYAVFAKHLQAWPLEECCRRVAEAGFAGLDLTVRPGGYVEPAEIREAFPRAMRAARAAGLEVPLLTTGLLSAEDPAADVTMAAAAEYGVRELKLHYWPCDGSVPVATAVERAKKALDGLAKRAVRRGVRVNIHNHSGDWVQSSAWVVAELVREFSPKTVGVYFDAAHHTIEGGQAGWRMATEILAPRVTLLAIKEGRWVEAAGGGPQERRWVPVGTGNVRWEAVLRTILASGFDGWASVHGEYQGPWSFKDLSAAEVLEQCAADRRAIEAIEAKLGG